MKLAIVGRKPTKEVFGTEPSGWMFEKTMHRREMLETLRRQGENSPALMSP